MYNHTSQAMVEMPYNIDEGIAIEMRMQPYLVIGTVLILLSVVLPFGFAIRSSYKFTREHEPQSRAGALSV